MGLDFQNYWSCTPRRSPARSAQTLKSTRKSLARFFIDFTFANFLFPGWFVFLVHLRKFICLCHFSLFFFFLSSPPLSFNVLWQEAQTIPCCPPADAASHVRACKGALDGKGATWAGDPTQPNRIPSLRSVRITGEALFSTELWYLSGQQEQAQC